MHSPVHIKDLQEQTSGFEVNIYLMKRGFQIRNQDNMVIDVPKAYSERSNNDGSQIYTTEMLIWS